MNTTKPKNKMLSLLLTLCMVAAILPMTATPALAADTGDFTVTGGTLNTDYSYADNILTILRSTELTISGTTTADRILVPTGVDAQIVLDGVSIVHTSGSDVATGYAFAIEGSGSVNLTLQEGSVNTLQSFTGFAGLQVPSDASLTIDGTGSLTATGGMFGAGIGGGSVGGDGSDAGIITINSGTITATGGSVLGGAAGIGGGGGSGNGGNGGLVAINGGTVTATGLNGAPGIGGGKGGTSPDSIDGTHGTVSIANDMEYATGQYGVGDNYTTAPGGVINNFPTDGYVKVRQITYWTDYAVQPPGSGTQLSPYLVDTAAELAWVAREVNAGRLANQHIKLQDTIDLAGHQWAPIGSAGANSFGGTFDGVGFKITNIDIRSGAAYVGLFGYLEAGAIVKNVGVSGEVIATSTNTPFVGGIAGSNYGTIINCYNMANVTTTSTNNNTIRAGGVVGDNNAGVVANCYNMGDISVAASNWSHGGIVGQNSGAVENCYNIGASVGADTDFGSVVGINFNSDNSVKNSYYLAAEGLKGVETNNGDVINVVSFVDADAQITWDDDTVHANLLNALNAGAVAFNATAAAEQQRAYRWEMLQGSDYPTLTAVEITGDANYDGVVTVADLINIAADGVYNTEAAGQSTRDVNRDGQINFADLAIARNSKHFGG